MVDDHDDKAEADGGAPSVGTGPADAAMHLDSQLCFALYAANRAVTGLYRPLLDELDLTYPQYLVMLVLWEAAGKEPLGVGTLGTRLRLDSGTLTPLLKRMEKQGLLVRGRQSVDERRVAISLTDAGLALKAKAGKIPLEVLCRAGLDLKETESLRQALKTMLARLDERGQS